MWECLQDRYTSPPTPPQIFHLLCALPWCPVMFSSEIFWTPRVHGVSDPRAHGVVRIFRDTPCARGTSKLTGHPVRTGLTWPVRTGSNGQKSPPGQEHYISPLLPPPSLNPNVLLSSSIATPHFAHYSQSLHPILLKLWGLGEQDPIYTLTKPNRIPRNIHPP